MGFCRELSKNYRGGHFLIIGLRLVRLRFPQCHAEKGHGEQRTPLGPYLENFLCYHGLFSSKLDEMFLKLSSSLCLMIQMLSIPPHHGARTRRWPLLVFLVFLCVGFKSVESVAHEIAILISADFPPYHQAVNGFASRLPPQTQVTQYHLKGDILQGQEMAISIRASQADLILAVGFKAAWAAQLEIVDVPVVFCLVLNPVDHGLTAPNMVGISLRVPSHQQLQAIQSVLPSVQSVGIVFDSEKSGSFVAKAEKDAQDLGVTLVSKEITDSSELPESLRTLLPQVNILWLIRDTTVITEESIPFILKTAFHYRRPVFGFSSGLAQHGALATLSVDYTKLGEQAGTLAKKILRQGALSSSLPQLLDPQQPQLAFNLGTSQFLGLSTPSKVIQLAGTVFGGSSVRVQMDASGQSNPKAGVPEDTSAIQ